MRTDESIKRCLDCGYMLFGLPKNRCPECGRSFNPDDPATFLTDRDASPVSRTAGIICDFLLYFIFRILRYYKFGIRILVIVLCKLHKYIERIIGESTACTIRYRKSKLISLCRTCRLVNNPVVVEIRLGEAVIPAGSVF